MKIKKTLALLLALAMVLGMAACGAEPTEPATTAPTAAPTEPSNPAPTEPAPTEPAPTEPAPTEPADPTIEDGEASITFDDGNFGFAAMYDGRANADASTLEVVEIYGNKALKVSNGSGKVPYLAIDLLSLLGENAANVASIEMLMGIENPDGKFYACSGNLMVWTGDKLSKTTYGWSVYMASKNPKVATFALKDYELISETNPVVVLTLETDNGAAAGAANANLLIYSMTFKDAAGNVLAADSAASFVAPEGFASDKDMSNLKYLKNMVTFDAMTGISGGAWGQNGAEMPEDFLAALVPGAVIEIEYTTTSATGDLWIVMPWAEAGWIRVCQQSATKNNSLNICQITYEDIAALCGDDTSKWGAMFQCESDGDWQVYSVKIGQDSGLVATTNKTAIDGFSVSGGGWAQNGIELTAEQWALMAPGMMLEVQYSSESGNLWAVLPWANAGWMRINADNGTTPICDGNTLQITYEQIAAICGEDVTTWGAMLQFESDTAWEVYAVSVCKPAVNVSGLVEIPGFSVSGGGWAQNGIELSAEQWAMMAPGKAIVVNYTSENGNLWAVLPWANAGWMRINADNGTTPVCDGETLIVTYEQIAAICGEDVTTWGAMLQFESDVEWEVYAVSIGDVSGATQTPDEGGNEGGEETPDEPAVEIPVPEIPAVPEGSTELYSGTTALSGWQMVTQVNTTVWGGTVDPANFTDGGYFTVYFTGENVYSVHLCFNGGVSASWVQLDCEVANAADMGDGTYAATFSMADMIVNYGSDMSALGAVMVYSNSDAAGYAIVTLVTYTPAA